MLSPEGKTDFVPEIRMHKTQEGVVGPRHRISPAPEMERSEEGHVAHVIHEIDEQPNDMFDGLVANTTGKDVIAAYFLYDCSQHHHTTLKGEMQ